MEPEERRAPEERADAYRKGVARRPGIFETQIAKEALSESAHSQQGHKNAEGLAGLGECHRASGHKAAIRRDLTVDLVETTDFSQDGRRRFERLAGSGTSREFERANRRNEQVHMSPGFHFRRYRGKPAGLRHQFDQHDRGNDWMARKVPLKKPIAFACRAPASRAHAGIERDDLFNQAHRRRMGKKIDRRLHTRSIQLAARRGRR